MNQEQKKVALEEALFPEDKLDLEDGRSGISGLALAEILSSEVLC